MLRDGNIGAAKLALKKNGLALLTTPIPPRSLTFFNVRSASRCGVAGIVFPADEEKVIANKKGGAIALPFGVFAWWYEDDTDLVVPFLGDTSKAHKAGQFTDFFLTGSNGIFTGFTTDYVSQAWDLEEDIVKSLVGSQPGSGIVKLDASFQMLEPKEH
ncbi:hypothetical protein ACJRO7_005010 [Eucalyptus globulus]|uniref:Cupin type-1 domain-containing protein n=1 Tax=Eucalyptus globulus TaxID=34317 RepID=A0ABD3IY95_EUCGL